MPSDRSHAPEAGAPPHSDPHAVERSYSRTLIDQQVF
jgi:hypothetical protein